MVAILGKIASVEVSATKTSYQVYNLGLVGWLAGWLVGWLDWLEFFSLDLIDWLTD